MKNHLNLTEGNILTGLLRFTIPILFTILLQTAYGTADLLIVGQFSEVSEVSGVVIGSQIMGTITSFCTGLSMGVTILVARHIGANEQEKSSKVIGAGIALFLVVGILITITLLLGNGQIAGMMQTPAEALAQTKTYLIICGAGSIFIVSYNLIGSVFRGIGDSNTPLLTVAIACVINIILDLIFVAGLDLGAMGAAIATVVAQSCSVFLSLAFIRKKSTQLQVSKQHICWDSGVIKDILKLGIPVALQGVLVGFSFLAITAIVNGIGVVASAAVGIVEKITGLIMSVPLAFMQSLSAYTAQNMGANREDRALKGLKYGMLMSLVFGGVTAYLAAFHGTLFTKLFTNDAEITVYALQYLKSYAFDCVMVAVMFSYSGYFNGYGKTTFVMIQSVIAALLIRVPLAYFFSTMEDTSLFIIGLATPTATLTQIVMCVLYFRHIHRK